MRQTSPTVVLTPHLVPRGAESDRRARADGRMPRLDRIYTKTGDEGMTGLGGGQRVPRTRSASGLRHGRRAELADRRRPRDRPAERLTTELPAHPERAVRPRVRTCAWPSDDRAAGSRPSRRATSRSSSGSSTSSTRSSGPDELPAAGRLARARRSSTSRARSAGGPSARPSRLARDEAIGEFVLPYLNRLSDALFVMARYENHERGVAEPLWQPGEYRWGLCVRSCAGIL